MFFFFYDYFKTENEFKDFVINALIAEAKQEKRIVVLDKKYGGQESMIFDICLDLGLKRFTGYNYVPTIVEVRFHYNESQMIQYIKYVRKEIQYIGKIVFLFRDDVEERVFDGDYDTLILGNKTVNDLIRKHKDVLTNSLVSDENVTFDFVADKKVEIKDKRNRFQQTSGQTFEISEKTVQDILNINIDRFKTKFRSDPAKCALILGNGLSIPFGSDNWSSMINNMLNYLNPYFVNDCESIKETLSHSNYAISSFVKSTLFSSGLDDKYYESITYSLYRKYNNLMHDENTLVKVVAKAKRKYKSIPLLTYNYDTFVERQYYHDYKNPLEYCDVSEYRTKLNKSVIHLHGYISYEHHHKKGIVLTDDEYFKTYESGSRSQVVETQEFVLKNYTCLFVGSSMSDIFQMSVIDRVRKHNKEIGWKCYAILKIDLDKIGLRGTIKLLEFYQKKGIQVIFTNSFDEMPNMLKDLLF